MKQMTFIRQRQAAWDDFANMLQTPAADSVLQFAAAYRQLCHDLSLARSRQYHPQLIARLNHLVHQGQQRLYQSPLPVWAQLWQLCGKRALHACYQFRYWIWSVLTLFYGVGALSALLVTIQPEAMYWFMDYNQIQEMNEMYRPDGRQQMTSRAGDSDLLMFGIYIYNNISIAFQTFAGGLLFAVGSLFYLIYNALILGAVAGHMINQGFTTPFFSFVVGHGSFELTAIALAGAAGCRMGYALLVPAQFTRLESLRQTAQALLPIIVLVFIWLMLAAVIEAFWSPRQIVPELKYTVGGLLWALVGYWLYRGTWRGA